MIVLKIEFFCLILQTVDEKVFSSNVNWTDRSWSTFHNVKEKEYTQSRDCGRWTRQQKWYAYGFAKAENSQQPLWKFNWNLMPWRKSQRKEASPMAAFEALLIGIISEDHKYFDPTTSTQFAHCFIFLTWQGNVEVGCKERDEKMNRTLCIVLLFAIFLKYRDSQSREDARIFCSVHHLIKN